ncbi:methyltransferase domain-containing protein [Phenylobacterium sp.]|uniref:class I SAM-dependent methyltransferase n=1 Tax=Phenylobacterium sp. TaxID=1871053 RepID=UPI00281130B1|nr:methyltransferase domain-containing protein [Phenylobacterium sp.]
MALVHYGCGDQLGPTWLNFDISPILRIARLPGGKLLSALAGVGDAFPPGVLVGDITKAPLVAPGTAAAAYASHVLEHMTLEDCRAALTNTYRMLAPGGVFRLIVPDMEWRARLYLEELGRGDPEAASNLMRYSILGQERRLGVVRRLRKAFSGTSHLWMWDFTSMSHELKQAGFVSIRRCQYGDAANPLFAEVENPDRFWGTVDSGARYPELAMEAVRPL